MRAMVCLTGAIDPEERLDFVPGRGASNLDSLRRQLNRADGCALEQALRLKNASRPVEVLGVALGPEAAEHVLRHALAQGADGVLRVWDEPLADLDAHSTAIVLAAAARRLKAELVLCGDRSSDGDSGQIPAQLAELLGWALVANVMRLEITASNEAVVEQRLERGLRQRLRCGLPAVFTVEEGAVQPRYARLRNRLRAKSASIPTAAVEELGLDARSLGERESRPIVVRISPPRPTSRGIFTPDAELSPEERLAQILAGGLEQRPAAAEQQTKGPIGALPAEQAEEIARFLGEGRFI